jgi:hypothetical protein
MSSVALSLYDTRFVYTVRVVLCLMFALSLYDTRFVYTVRVVLCLMYA